MKKNLYYPLLFTLAFFVLNGCSPDPSSSTEKRVDAEPKVNHQEQAIPEAPETLEDMLDQKPGNLVNKHLDPELEIINGFHIDRYRTYMDETFYPIIEKELARFFKKYPDLSNEEIYDYLVYQLASGQYAEYNDKLLSFDHGYEMPELPESEEEVLAERNMKTNIVILLDSSGSMKQEVNGGIKMELAKQSIRKFTENLGQDSHISLIAYGHKGTGSEEDKEKSCKAIETVYPLGSLEHGRFSKAMDSFQASGWTPLSAAIDKASAMLSTYPKEKFHNKVFIVSDGIETCDGDPTKAVSKLRNHQIDATVNIIGFDVDDEGQQQLKEIAEAGGGEYDTVKDKQELEKVVSEKWRPSRLQIITTHGVSLPDYAKQYEELVNIKNALFYSSLREEQRIKHAINELYAKRIIDSGQRTILIEKTEEMHRVRNEYINETYDKKEQEAKLAKEEIEAKVDAWKKKWSDVLDAEGL